MQGLVAEPVLQLVAVGDVFHHRELVLRLAARPAHQGDRQVGPHRVAIAAEELLLRAEELPVAPGQLPVCLVGGLGVARMEEFVQVVGPEVLQ